ncbi:MAG: hypothetical protein M1822_010001 [Bathelium mastoideum]|nr:MAG: hypothetical protein M1822_010001 [Bathelium mastoideum]
MQVRVDTTAAQDAAEPATISPTPNSASSGTKRKREPPPKFYAVRVGHEPGIYHSWSECLEQVRGFKNATFKSFTTLTDAESFMNPNSNSKSSQSSAGTPQKFYAVQNGRVPGVYEDWASAQQQITGWTRPKHKAFTSRAEAEAFVNAAPNAGDAVSNVIVPQDSSPAAKKAKKSGSGKDNSASKKTNGAASSPNPAFDAREEEYEPGTGPLPLDAEDGFDPSVLFDPESGIIKHTTDEQKNATKWHATGPSKGSMLRIYTDGSSLGNGQNGSIAGVGVFFGPEDPRASSNLSEPLPGPRQTNQRAELTALLRALDLTPHHLDATILSDSSYAINCVTVWHRSWEQKNWQTSAKKPVENRDIIEKVLEKIRLRDQVGSSTVFEWVKGHAKDPGNLAADGLAVLGAKEARDRRSEAALDGLAR